MEALFSNLPLMQAAPAGGSMLSTVLIFGLVILIFYFLIIRPQSKQKKETQRMLGALKKGDKVSSIGGIRGTVQSVKDKVVILKVDDNTKLEFSKNAIATVLEQKEAKSEKAEAETEND